jgi:DNA adenine methylase
MKPLMKWVGGKTQIIDEVFQMFPQRMVNYFEPFVGGGSVLMELLRRQRIGELCIDGKTIASDVNPRLIWFYKNIQTNPQKVWEYLSNLDAIYRNCFKENVEEYIIHRNPQNIQEANTSPESMYYWQRKRYNDATIESPEAAALFLFLNKTCFRGIYREGPSGFNVAFGNYKNIVFPDEHDLSKLSVLLARVEFRCSSFEDVLREAREGDFVYLDPPYAPENEKSFVGYTKHGFGKDMHDKLFKLIKSLSNQGIRILMSNADVDMVKDNFNHMDIFKIKQISCRRTINSKNPGSRTNEVLIWNFI